MLFDRLTGVAAYEDLVDGDPVPTRADGRTDCPWETASIAGDTIRYSARLPRYDGGAAYGIAASGWLQFRDLGNATPNRLYVNWSVRTSRDLSAGEYGKLISIREGLQVYSSYVACAPTRLTWLSDIDHDGTPDDMNADYHTWEGAADTWTNLELRVDSSDRDDTGRVKVEALTDHGTIHRAEFRASEPLNYIAYIGLKNPDPPLCQTSSSNGRTSTSIRPSRA